VIDWSLGVSPQSTTARPAADRSRASRRARSRCLPALHEAILASYGAELADEGMQSTKSWCATDSTRRSCSASCSRVATGAPGRAADGRADPAVRTTGPLTRYLVDLGLGSAITAGPPSTRRARSRSRPQTSLAGHKQVVDLWGRSASIISVHNTSHARSAPRSSRCAPISARWPIRRQRDQTFVVESPD
jgi:hypothetical protein